MHACMHACTYMNAYIYINYGKKDRAPVNVEAGSRDTQVGLKPERTPGVDDRVPLYEVYTQLLLLFHRLKTIKIIKMKTRL